MCVCVCVCLRARAHAQAPCRAAGQLSAGQISAASMLPRRCREAKSQLVFRPGFELVPVGIAHRH